MGAIMRTRSGFSLLIVLLGVLVLSSLATAALEVGGDEMSAARATRVSTSAMFLADAGVTATRVTWPGGASSLAPGAKWGPDTTTLTDGSKYIRTITRRDNGSGTDVYSLRVESVTFGALGGEAALEVWLSSLPPSRFRGAIGAAAGVVDIGSSGRVDSYNSTLGLYGVGGNVGSDGDIFANGDLKISGSANVAGSAAIGGKFTDSSSGSVTGGVTTGASAVTYPPETCPSGGYSGIPSGYQAGVKYVSGDLTMGSGDTLFIHTSGTYFWHDITLSGGQFVMDAGVTATIYLAAKFTVSGGGGVNNKSKIPSNMSIIACDPPPPATKNTEAWVLSGGSDGYFTVYAPTHKVTQSGSSPMYGAVVCYDFTSSGGSQLHYDTALLGDVSARPNLIGRSWFQVLR
jgi:hypothetical protein